MSFDEEEDYLNEQLNEQTDDILEKKQKQRYIESEPLRQETEEDSETNDDLDTDENNGVQYSNKSDSSLNIKMVPLTRNNRRSK